MVNQPFITILSIIIIMVCLAASYPPPRLTNNQETTKDIIDDFEKTLKIEKSIEKSILKENFESEPAQVKLGWAVYQSGPFNNISTYYTRDPVFYEKKIYRKPYMWPATFKSSYPIEHQSTLDPKF